jgi:hypothetical protein
MALVQGHAIRRREGIAPNPQVMAESGSTTGWNKQLTCPVKGCSSTRYPAPGITPDALQASMDQHVILSHPRHRSAAEARQRYGGR